MIDDDVTAVDEPLPVARRADRSAQSARFDRSKDRRARVVSIEDEIHEEERTSIGWLTIVGTLGVVALGVAVLVLAIGLLGGCWLIALPLMGIAALLKSGRPQTGH